MRIGPFDEKTRLNLRRIGAVADVKLGKMLQPARSGATDRAVPYLRAGSISSLGDSAALPEMYASSWDAANYAVTSGDLLVTEGGDVGKTAFVPSNLPKPTIIQNSLHRVRPRQGDVRFLRYALDVIYGSGWLDVLCNRSTFGHLTVDKLSSIQIPWPDPVGQRAIADYLDIETARIDTLVAKKQSLMQAADERWHAQLRWLVHASDWPWVPLRRLWEVTDCKHVTPAYVESGFPVVSPGDVTPGRLDLRRCHRNVDERTFAQLTSGNRRPARGDIVYSRNASIGIASFVDTDEPFTMGQDVCLIRSSSQDQVWLTYMLNSVGVDQLQEMKIGSTFDRVNIAQLMDLRIPAPDPQVQRIESRKLDAARAKADQLRDLLGRQIALLREHRQALITAAVAGELEIPGVAL